MMKMMKSLLCVLLITISIACKGKKDKDSITKDEPTLTEEIEVIKTTNPMVLKEDSLNDISLKKGMALEIAILEKYFPNAKIKKEVGQQDGPDYVFYTIDKDVVFSTSNTQSSVLSHIAIKGNSRISDAYGIEVGYTFDDIKAKRPDIKIVTEHFHIYLYEKGSNISYEMSLKNYNGPDKDNYTLDDLEGAKVISIIWDR